MVTCDVGGAREIITNNTAGRLVERTPEAVAAGVNDVLNNPPMRQAVAAMAEKFSWDTNAIELAAHYEDLLGKR